MGKNEKGRYMSKEHLNYLRRKTADEAELWAADRIEELEHELAAERKRASSYKLLVSSMEKQKNIHLAERIKFRESLATLDSERAANERLTQERDALQADNARLREALNQQLNDCINFNGGQLTICIMEASTEALAATPAQSLARLRNQVREEHAAILDDDDADLYDLEFHAAAIRATKEPE